MSLATIVLLAATLILLLAGVWVGAALGLAAFLAVLSHEGGAPFGGFAYAAWNGINNPVLTAVPLFLLMGQAVLRTGISADFYRALALWLERAPGGLLQTNIVASGVFSAIAGNSVATAATISEVAYPELKRRNYSTKLSVGSLAGGGTLGILIPPSIPLILYAALVSVSVVDLFAAAIVPGLLLLLAFMVYVAVAHRRNPVVPDPATASPDAEAITWSHRVTALRDLVPLGILIVVVLGGIYAGVVTVTEASALGAVGALLIAAVMRKLTLSKLWQILRRTAEVTAMIMLIIVGAHMLSYALAITGGARELAAVITDMAPNKTVFLILVYVLFLFLGLFMEGISMMLLTMPILFPLLQLYEVDLVWFAIVMVILIEIGLITPPVGVNLFILQGVSKEPLGVIFRGAFPYVLIMLGAVGVLTLFPEIVLWLPGRS
ncbi:TRAP transporter large permease [Nocardioides houyundeii]|uniref:TRAP transporter large permease n=1 Tax=Nocardioides houyundeii TaxID=2045452 RepID=UPI000C76ACDC|nr:TRAP transporter large permease [Nocardioides houyundeii]